MLLFVNVFAVRRVRFFVFLRCGFLSCDLEGEECNDLTSHSRDSQA